MAALTVADLPFLGGQIVHAKHIESAIAVPVGTDPAEVERLCREYVATWRASDATGELVEVPRQHRTLHGRTHWSFKAARKPCTLTPKETR